MTKEQAEPPTTNMAGSNMDLACTVLIDRMMYVRYKCKRARSATCLFDIYITQIYMQASS
jgi:hypothetical protein